MGKSEMEGEKVLVEKVLTPGVLLIGIVLLLLTSVLAIVGVVTFTPGAFYKWYGDTTWNFSGITSMVMFVTFVSLLLKLGIPAFRLNSKKFTIIYLMIMSGLLYSMGLGYPLYVLAMWAGIRIHPSLAYWEKAGFVPAWVPSKAAFEAMSVGGQPVPWNEWGPAIIVLALWVLLSWFLLGSINMVFRRQWIEVERMEFPVGAIVAEYIHYATNPREPTLWPKVKRFLLIGFIPSLIFFSQFWIALFVPWFPNLTKTWTSWPWIPWHQGLLDIGMAVPAIWDVLPGAGFNIMLSPWVFSFSYLAPLDVLLGGFVFWIIGCIFLQWAFVMLGLYPKPVFPGWGSSMASWNFYVAGKMTFFIESGMWWALGLVPILIGGNWRYVVGTIRSAIRGPSAEEKRNEPLPYRWSWVMFIVALIAYIAYLSAALGMPAYVALIILVIWVIYHLGNVRMRGLAGFPISDVFDSYAGLPFFIGYAIPEFTALPSAGMEQSSQAWFAVEMFNWHACFTLSSPSYLGQGSLNAEAYRIAALSGISSKDAFRAMLIAVVISVFFSLPVAIAVMYQWGLAPPGMATIWAYATPRAGDQMPGWRSLSGEPEVVQPIMATYIIAGFIFMTLMIWLKLSFVWWPFHPTGVLLGMSYFSGFLGFGAAFGITYFFKWLTLKLGGVKAYEDWGIPIACGLAVGYAVAMVLWNLASIVLYIG